MAEGSVAVGTDRADRLADALTEREADLLLVTDLVNLRWLTGFTGSSGAAVVGREGTRRFVTDFRYLTQSAEQLDAGWRREIAPEILQASASFVGGDGAPVRLGFDDATLSVKDYESLKGKLAEGVELVAAGGLIEGLRAVKDADEQAKIRAAAKVALDLEVTMRKAGAEAVSFPPIIASGEHSALPHAEPRDVEIPRNTLVTIDWGAQLDGYASDCTRTYATGPDLDPRDREVYELVLKAQLESLAAVRAGAGGREVDAVARDVITAAGHGEHFGHGLGHGVGAEVHEGPRLSQRSEATLETGQVVTVEPGVYVPGAVGVRIEDLAIVTDDGAEVLTSLPKDLQVID
jgi:Xaa-Pro aminopeptidase